MLIPMDATQLYLDGNNFGPIGAGLQQNFIGRQRLEALYLNNSGLTQIGHSAFTGLSNLRTLDLSGNQHLRELKGFEFSSGLHSLESLKLDHCGLVYVHEMTFKFLPNLKQLTLHSNLLTTFPVWKLEVNSQLTGLTLSQNVWSCHCDFIAPLNTFLQNNLLKIADYEQVQCVSENAMALDQNLCLDPVSVTNRQPKQVIEETQIEVAAILIPTTVISLAILIIGLLAIFVFKKQINAWFYSTSKTTSSSLYDSRSCWSTASGGQPTSQPLHLAEGNVNNGKNGAKLFDLYISYAKQDSEFVDHNLAPTLEYGHRSNSYRLCLHHRDFPNSPDSNPGLQSVYDTVSLASESSAKILLVLSKAYLATEWHSVKNAIWDHLQKTCTENLEDKLVILLIDDISDSEIILTAPELLTYFQHCTVKWGSQGFMSKLRFFLPEPVHATFARTVTLRSIGHQNLAQSHEHLYHYIPDTQPVYQAVELKANNSLAFSLQQTARLHKQFQNVTSTSHSHSLSTSSGQRLLTNPEEYIV